MKPLGQHPVRFPSKTDCHPPKGYVNWWEGEIDDDENKALAKRFTQLEIKEQLAELEDV
jgi:hypothetical protein